MTENYQQEDIDKILLSKNLNEFYLATIENRQELLTDEEYQEITTRDSIIYGENKEEMQDLFKKIETNKNLKGFVPEIMKAIYSLSKIRYIAILTMINDDVYDIGNAKFEDLRRNKIIHYDNLANYYDEKNARIRFFTPEEEPQLQQKTVLLDVDDESIIRAYENKHITQEESEDLSSQFLTEVKGKSYTLKRKKSKI